MHVPAEQWAMPNLKGKADDLNQSYRKASSFFFFTNKSSYYEKDTFYDLYTLQSWHD